jgi:hypothetical protein
MDDDYDAGYEDGYYDSYNDQNRESNRRGGGRYNAGSCMVAIVLILSTVLVAFGVCY